MEATRSWRCGSRSNTRTRLNSSSQRLANSPTGRFDVVHMTRRFRAGTLEVPLAQELCMTSESELTREQRQSLEEIGLDDDGQRRFAASLQKWQEELQPLAAAIDEAERLTESDLAIRINTRE